jgi:hypothetical protein
MRTCGWSLYGAPWLQPVAISRKSCGRKSRRNKRNPLPPPATGCVGKYMVSRASAVGCHPLREAPSLRRRGSTRGRLGLSIEPLTQASHCSSIIQDLLFARMRLHMRAPYARTAGSGERTLAQRRVHSAASVILSR